MSEKIFESFEVEDFMIQIKLLVHVWIFFFFLFVCLFGVVLSFNYTCKEVPLDGADDIA